MREGESDAPNRFRAMVENVTFLGETLEYELRVGDGREPLRAVAFGGGRLPARGEEIELAVAPEDIVLL